MLSGSETGGWPAPSGQIMKRLNLLCLIAALLPAGKHTAWAYCHVPNGGAEDMADAIESRIERFAPGFRARILARHVLTPAGLELLNPNLAGGDSIGGAMDLRQCFFRPRVTPGAR